MSADRGEAQCAPESPGCPCTPRMFVMGAVFMGIAVALGAFGAHGLRAHTDANGLATWETAVRYQAWHALGLMLLSLAGTQLRPGAVKPAGICFVIGTLIFSGSLYTLVLTGQKWLGAITPIGGVLFIIGWILTAVQVRKFR